MQTSHGPSLWLVLFYTFVYFVYCTLNGTEFLRFQCFLRHFKLNLYKWQKTSGSFYTPTCFRKRFHNLTVRKLLYSILGKKKSRLLHLLFLFNLFNLKVKTNIGVSNLVMTICSMLLAESVDFNGLPFLQCNRENILACPAIVLIALI